MQALLEFFIDITGTIDVKELMEIVGNLYEMEGFSKVIHHNFQVNLSQFAQFRTQPMTEPRQCSNYLTKMGVGNWTKKSLLGVVSGRFILN